MDVFLIQSGDINILLSNIYFHSSVSVVSRGYDSLIDTYQLVKVDKPTATETNVTAEVNEVNAPPDRSMMNRLDPPIANS